MFGHVAKVNEALLYQLRCYVLPADGVRCPEEYAFQYDQAYLLWRLATLDMLQQLKIADQLNQFSSDSFLLFDYMLVLYFGATPVGLLMAQTIDLYRPPLMEQHYMQLYPKRVVETLQATGRWLMVMGNFCIHPDWRQSAIGPGIADLLTSMMTIYCYLPSRAEHLTVITRNECKTNELAFRHGAEPLVSGHFANNCDTDIILFAKDKVHLSSMPGVAPIATFLWRHRVDPCQIVAKPEFSHSS